ncbi:MAG TPA: hypothetical protein VMT54_04835 [Candidatus Cybelea sp.]|nr:hypothetical protein [Candidatus Cybelea sp.]
MRRKTLASLVVLGVVAGTAWVPDGDLAPGVALGEAVDSVQQAVKAVGAPAALFGTFQGNAQAFQDSLKTEPI